MNIKVLPMKHLFKIGVTDNNSGVDGDGNKPQSWLGARHMMVVLMFLSTVIAYANRVSMSMAIVAMTSENDHGYPVFKWERTYQDTILSSFFWGYIILQIPAGMLVTRFGGKNFAFVSVLSNGIISMLIPLAAVNADWIGVCACRVAMGVTQGMLFPSLHGLLGQWAPAPERSRMGTFVYAGSLLGTIIEMMSAGVLSASSWGWPSIFYISGAVCLVWSVAWFFFAASTPSQCRWISKEERKYIEMTAGSTDINKKVPIPWKSIWTSLPFWSILISHSGQSLGYWTLLTEMPSYMRSVLGVDIKSNGMLSALPYIAMYLLSFVFSWSSDFLINNNHTSIATSRKMYNTIALWGPAVALLALSYLPAGHLTWAVVILTITVGLNGAHYVGFLISHIDLSPNHASTLMGLTNGISNIFSIMAPLLVTLVVEDETRASDWRRVFFISIAFYIFSNGFYLAFMSGETQPWNEPEHHGHPELGMEKKESTASAPTTPPIEH